MRRNRRKQSSALADIIDLLAMLPWWVSLIGAVFCYLMFAWLQFTSTSFSVGDSSQIVSTLVKFGYQAGQYLVPIVLVTSAGLSFFARKHRKDLLQNAHIAQDLSQMGWREFELLIGEVYRRRGYSVRELGGDGPDGGVDLVLKKPDETILVQCKHWKAVSVGVDVVRQIYGVMAAKNATACKVVISGAYTEAALQFAIDANKSSGGQIELIDGPKLFALIRDVHPTAGLENNRGPFDSIDLSKIPLEESPVCPKCGSGMSKHRSKKGRHAGKEFFGCTRFPDCRSIIAIE